MTNTKFRLAKYYDEFDEANFEYYEGMTIDVDGSEPAKIIAEFGTEEEAMNELKSYESWYRKYSSFYGVTEYIVETVVYDDEDIDEIGYIGTAKIDEGSIQDYIKSFFGIYEQLDDFEVKEDSDTFIKPIYWVKVKGKYYITKEFIEIEELDEYEDKSDKLDFIEDYLSDLSLLGDLEEYKY